MTLLSVRVAAIRLGIAYSTLNKWIYAGRVRMIQTAGGHHRIPEEEVDRLSSRPASPSRIRKLQGDPAATKGWGFERFNGNSPSERMVTAADSQCVTCHAGPNAKDLVFSKFRE